MAQPFYLGLNMSGTVSAGAYTAGVIDFLIEAMDTWYAERERQLQRFGNNYEQWTIPPHELQLSVMAGASGGGITSALAAAALSQSFNHIHEQSPGPDAPLNTLFRSWVTEIDLKLLLGHADLDRNGGNVVSILDSTPIRQIAVHALAISSPLPQRRPWVRDGLKVILTLTNLGGIPYAIEPQSDADSARVLYHADHRDFEVLWNGQPSGGHAVALRGTGGDPWAALAEAAVATSAFPIVLAPQVLHRTAGEYNQRRWRIPQANPKCGPGGTCICELNTPMPPVWDFINDDLRPLETLNVDGGATNNSPFDCARLELAGLFPPAANGHNPRDPKYADRAVVSIAPLFTEAGTKLPPLPKAQLGSLLGQFIQVLVSQSRIQGENLKLTSDPSVASRWLIAPTSEQSGIDPLAGSLLGAFGAFISRVLREHDYQLGRRNCQRFLTNHFGLPWDNVIINQYDLSGEAKARLDAIFGFAGEPAAGSMRLFPLIPVLADLRQEVKVVRKPVAQDELKVLADMAVDRGKRVAKALLSQTKAGWFSELAFNSAWLMIKGRFRDGLFDAARHELGEHGFLS